MKVGVIVKSVTVLKVSRMRKVREGGGIGWVGWRDGEKMQTIITE